MPAFAMKTLRTMRHLGVPAGAGCAPRTFFVVSTPAEPPYSNMRKIAVSACLLTGCVGSSAEPQTFTANWSLKDAKGAQLSCTPPYDKVKIRAMAVSSLESPRSLDAVFEKLFDCAAGTGTIELPTGGESAAPECFADCDYNNFPRDMKGKYFMTLWITDASGELFKVPSPQLTEIAESFPRYAIDLSSGPKTQDFTLYPTAGFLFVGWELLAASDKTNLSCAASSVDEVRMTAQELDAGGELVAGGATVEASFPCKGDPQTYMDFTVGSSLSPPMTTGYWLLQARGYGAGALIAERDMSIGDGGGNKQTVKVGAADQDFGVRFDPLLDSTR